MLLWSQIFDIVKHYSEKVNMHIFMSAHSCVHKWMNANLTKFVVDGLMSLKVCKDNSHSCTKAFTQISFLQSASA